MFGWWGFPAYGIRGAAYATLKGNADFVDLLSKAEMHDDLQRVPAKTEITSDVVRWLNRIIPIAAG